MNCIVAGIAANPKSTSHYPSRFKPKIYDIIIPNIPENKYEAVIYPLTSSGECSDKNNTTDIKLIPNPIPTTNRPKHRANIEVEKNYIIAPKAKNTSDDNTTTFLPNLSVAYPESKEAGVALIKYMLTKSY